MIQIQTVIILSNGQIMEVMRMITKTPNVVKPTRILKFPKNFKDKEIEMGATCLYYFGLLVYVSPFLIGW